MTLAHQLTVIEFEKCLVELLSAFRDEDIFALHESHLFSTPLFQDILLLDESVSLATSPEMATAVIGWGIDQFKPLGEQDQYSNLWRPYIVLNGYYNEKKTIAFLSEYLSIADQTFYEWRANAISRLAKLLHRECYLPAHLSDRQERYVVQKLQALAECETQLLTLVSLIAVGENIVGLFSKEEIVCLKKFEEMHLIESAKSLEQPAELKRHILNQISQARQFEGHQSLFVRFKRSGMIRLAIKHGFHADKIDEVIQLTVENKKLFFKAEGLNGLTDLFRQIIAIAETRLNIDPNLWADFLLIASQAAHWEDNLDLALSYSRQALSAPDLQIKLNAYYQRAKQLSRLNLDECLSHYAVCFDLVNRVSLGSKEDPQNPIRRLITQMYIDRAWIYIQERPDYECADKDLKQAESYIPAEASGLWCDLYNGRAELVARTQSAKEALPFHLKAFTSAEESGDIERMTKVAYNVGLDYMYSGQYENSLSYFEKSKRWAQQSGNVQTLGLAQKGLGGSYFFLEQFDLALEHYHAAYQSWKPTQNISWLTSICYDLAEGYATVNDFVNGRGFYNEGRTLATQLGHQRFIAEFDALLEQFPALEEKISDRQAEALAYSDQHSGISRQQYIELTGVAKSQAYRDLEEMCQEGLLVRVGKGRGTKYVRSVTS